MAGNNLDNETPTTTASTRSLSWVWNRGVQNSQVLFPPGVNGFGTTATANTYLTVDTSANQTVAVNGTLANAADFIVLEAWRVTGFPQYN